MKQRNGWRIVLFVAGSLLAIGCSKDANNSPTPSSSGENVAAQGNATREAGQDDDVSKALAELSEEDRAVAVAQKYCPVAAMNDSESLLGSMGKPYKVILDGKPVFLCCEHCQEDAEKDAAKTLAKVEELKQQTKASAN